MIVRSGEVRLLEISGRTVNSFGFNVKADAPPSGTTIVDFSKVVVKCTLKRAGNEIVLFQDILKPLLMASNFGNSIFPNVFSGASNHTIDTGNELGLNCKLDLGGAVNISGSDVLTLEVNVLSGALFGVNDFIDVNEYETIGVEYATPLIQSRAINGGESRFRLGIGDNVQSLYFINMDKSSNLASDNVLGQVVLDSDKINLSDQWSDLLVKRLGKFEVWQSATNRNQSFDLITANVPLNKVTVDLHLNASNVSTSQNFLVWRSFVTSPELVAKARNMSERHAQQNMSDILKVR